MYGQRRCWKDMATAPCLMSGGGTARLLAQARMASWAFGMPLTRMASRVRRGCVDLGVQTSCLRCMHAASWAQFTRLTVTAVVRQRDSDCLSPVFVHAGATDTGGQALAKQLPSECSAPCRTQHAQRLARAPIPWSEHNGQSPAAKPCIGRGTRAIRLCRRLEHRHPESILRISERSKPGGGRSIALLLCPRSLEQRRKVM